ncbi:hypothetical protein [Fodinibius sediminis]|nr:hypothetical protein [Fodinibius sediminis]
MPSVLHEYNFKSIEEFLDAVTHQKCSYYASHFLAVEEGELAQVDDSVQHSLQIFKTLDLSTEEHFFPVYRGGPDYVYKDWKLSPLARVLMLVDGDPTNVREIARKQTELIDRMLNHM